MVRRVVSIVSPVYCEEDGIEAFHRRAVAVLDNLEDRYDGEIVYVNDGSFDRSGEVLRKFCQEDSRIRLVELSRNFGHQLAITAGIDHARGDAIVVIDSDLQDAPEVIERMVEQWEDGFKVVYGVRTAREGESRFKLVTAKVFYRLVNWLSDVQLPEDSGDFRLMDRQVIEVLRGMREENRYLRGMVAWVGFPQTGIPYERDPRYAGETKYTLRKMLRFAVDGVTSFSERPLRMATQLGLIIMALALAFMVWILVGFAVYHDTVPGWPSLMATILFLGGVQLLCVGVVGAYVGRVYRESKDRPLYVVAERINMPADDRSPA
jgi:dolichol-phosphate mannosyltransferase